MLAAEVILAVADRALRDPERYLAPGWNGPYRDAQTPVRNAGHWCITFLQCHDWIGGKHFLREAQQLVGSLFTTKARPHGYTFHHRDKHGKDRCNGLIGQAWTIEALGEVARALGDERCAKLAEDVFLLHPMAAGGLWYIVDVDGRRPGIDPTLNHQLWFAAAGAGIGGANQDRVDARIRRFLDRLSDNLAVSESGLIRLPLKRHWEAWYAGGQGPRARMDRARARTRAAVGGLLRGTRGSGPCVADAAQVAALRQKAIGYHAFNTYAMGILKQRFRTHAFWSSETAASIASFLQGEAFVKGLEGNRYGYPYNAPGFEVPYSLYGFAGVDGAELVAQTAQWLTRQFDACWDGESWMFSRNTPDPVTLTARIYELTRLPREVLEQVPVPVDQPIGRGQDDRRKACVNRAQTCLRARERAWP